MKATPLELGPYTGGVNLYDPPSKLSPNELLVCKNLRTGDRGDFYKRPGHASYGTAPEKINGNALVNLVLRFYKSDGTKRTIAASGGLLKFGNDATGAWTNISINGSGAAMSAVNLCDWEVYKNRLYIVDGLAAQRYNLTDDIYAGHFIHAAPTLAQAAGGSLTLLATYKYFVTSVAGDMGEGPKGAEATFTLTGANNRIDLSAMAAAPAKHEETFKRIYRTKANGTLFYFLTEIATGTTTFNDTLADTALGAEFVPTRIPPANARFIIKGHDERMYYFGMSGADASLVLVSEVGFPDRILNNGIGGFFTVSNNDNDILTGGGLSPGGILFLKRNSAWLSRGFGFPPINISPKEKRGGGVGSTAPLSAVATPVGLIFVSQRGEIYKFDGTNLEEIGRRISSEFKGMTESAMGRIVACYHNYRYIVSYDYRGTKGYNWKTIEYDVMRDKWEGPHENGDFYNPSYYSVWDSAFDKGELYWGEAKAGNGSYIYGRSEFTETDRGNKFISIARGGALPLAGLGNVKTTKVFAKARISSDVTLTFTHIDENESRTSVNLNAPIAANPYYLDAANCLLDNIILSGSTSSILEGSLGPSANSKIPIYEISDNGTAIELSIELLKIKAVGLPLK